mmetsp:Transcript_3785/g.6436  ORF Transcript_3785/g.6436 Transcript_3785/m.6436 type:complete len:205 (-) Transcript_3785:455-1069(-)
MRRHSMSRHQSPRMCAWRRLREPHIACIATNMSAIHCVRQRILVDNLASRRIHNKRARFASLQHFAVKQVFRTAVQRTIDGDHVQLRHHRLHSVMKCHTQRLLLFRRQSLNVIVMQSTVKRFQSLQYAITDSTCRDRTHLFTFQIPGAVRNCSNIPFALNHLFVRRYIVAYQRQDLHHYMLRYGHDIGASHFRHCDTGIPCLFQ